MANAYVEGLLARLSGRDPLEVLAATPSRLEELFWELGEKGLDRDRGEGTWTARAIFAHLADAEISYAFRFRQVLAEADHRIQPYDQNAWAGRYARADVSLALELFRALRLWNLNLLRSISDEDWQRRTFHPERGEESIRLMAALLAGHDLNHIEQLESIRDAR